MKEKRNLCLFDSRNRSYNLGKKNALWTPHFEPDAEWLEENDWYDPEGGYNPDYEDCANMFWEDIQKFDSETKLNGFLITGQLGLWHGRPDVCPVIAETLETALRKCWSSCDDFRVDYCNGVITCFAYHHDGTNIFEIRGISVSRMTERQQEEYDEPGRASTHSKFDGCYSGKLFDTPRHLRKIDILKRLGIVEKACRTTESC